jgi:hypothetical protein
VTGFAAGTDSMKQFRPKFTGKNKVENNLFLLLIVDENLSEIREQKFVRKLFGRNQASHNRSLGGGPMLQTSQLNFSMALRFAAPGCEAYPLSNSRMQI